MSLVRIHNIIRCSTATSHCRSGFRDDDVNKCRLVSSTAGEEEEGLGIGPVNRTTSTPFSCLTPIASSSRDGIALHLGAIRVDTLLRNRTGLVIIPTTSQQEKYHWSAQLNYGNQTFIMRSISIVGLSAMVLLLQLLFPTDHLCADLGMW